MSTTRPRLVAAIRKALAERNETAADLAGAIGVSGSTLRTWLTRQRFPADKAVQIAAHLGWNLTAEQLEQRYDVGRWASPAYSALSEQKSLAQHFQEHDRNALRMAEVHATAPPLGPLFDSLQAGDLYIAIGANMVPLELEMNSELLDAAVRAASRGAFLIYVIPTEALYRRWEDEFSIRKGFAGSELTTGVASAREALRAIQVATGMAPERIERYVTFHVGMLQVDDFPWFSPTSNTYLMGTLNPLVREPLMRSWMTFPGNIRSRLLLPLSDQLSLRIASAVFRLTISRLPIQAEVGVFNYLMEFPGTWAF